MLTKLVCMIKKNNYNQKKARENVPFFEIDLFFWYFGGINGTLNPILSSVNALWSLAVSVLFTASGTLKAPASATTTF